MLQDLIKFVGGIVRGSEAANAAARLPDYEQYSDAPETTQAYRDAQDGFHNPYGISGNREFDQEMNAERARSIRIASDVDPSMGQAAEYASAANEIDARNARGRGASAVKDLNLNTMAGLARMMQERQDKATMEGNSRLLMAEEALGKAKSDAGMTMQDGASQFVGTAPNKSITGMLGGLGGGGGGEDGGPLGDYEGGGGGGEGGGDFMGSFFA